MSALKEAELVINRLREEIAHWKANHDTQARRCRELLDRPDLADRAKSILAKDSRIAELSEHIEELATKLDSLQGINEALEARIATLDAHVRELAHSLDIANGFFEPTTEGDV